MDLDLKTEILYQLDRHHSPMTLGWLCDTMGIKRGRNGRYAKRAYAMYSEVAVELQKLKRAGRVLVRRGAGYGPGGSWELTSSERDAIASRAARVSGPHFDSGSDLIR